VGGLPRTFEYIARPLDAHVGWSVVEYVRLTRRGRFAVRVRLFHAELDGNGPWIDAAINVARDGTTTIERLSDQTSAVVEGRCMDFERAREGDHS
jgi:hypothetical protein